MDGMLQGGVAPTAGEWRAAGGSANPRPGGLLGECDVCSAALILKLRTAFLRFSGLGMHTCQGSRVHFPPTYIMGRLNQEGRGRGGV